MFRTKFCRDPEISVVNLLTGTAIQIMRTLFVAFRSPHLKFRVTVVRGRPYMTPQGGGDNSTQASVIKSVTMGGGVKKCSKLRDVI